MARILVITDSRIGKAIWKKSLDHCLQDMYELQDFRYLESRKTGPTSIKWATTPYEGVREARGDPEQIKAEIGDIEILIVNFAPITEDVIDAANELKLIASTRGGPLNVDTDTATKRGILVTHTHGRLAPAVADHTIGMILAEARHIARANSEIRNRRFFKNPDIRETWFLSVPEMEEKTLGIIGFGNVGREVAKRATGFSMKILAYDPFIPEDTIRKTGCNKVDLETLLQESDFVTIHTRESPETLHLIGREQLDLMKPRSYLINTSRGSIIDEKALYKALKDRKIAGASLDVVEDEPLKADNPLLTLDNITVTPHMAGASDRASERSALQVGTMVAQYLKQNILKPKDLANPSVLIK